MKVVLPVAITWAAFAFYLTGPAVDHELAQASEGATVTVTGATAPSELVDGHDVQWWARHSRYMGRLFRQADKDRDARGATIKRLKRHLGMRSSDSLAAIAYASTAYGVSYSMLKRKASCETGGTFDPYAKNRSSSASGLFQFLTSTWASTPYASYSIWDPYANALAAGWMHAHGRGGEWACR